MLSLIAVRNGWICVEAASRNWFGWWAAKPADEGRTVPSLLFPGHLPEVMDAVHQNGFSLHAHLFWKVSIYIYIYIHTLISEVGVSVTCRRLSSFTCKGSIVANKAVDVFSTKNGNLWLVDSGDNDGLPSTVIGLGIIDHYRHLWNQGFMRWDSAEDCCDWVEGSASFCWKCWLPEWKEINPRTLEMLMLKSQEIT